MIKKDQFEFLFQKFRNFAIEINDFTQNIQSIFRRNSLRDLYLGIIGSYVDRLADIRKFVEENTQWSLDYSDCISTVQKKYKNYKKRIKKDLNRFKDILVSTESEDSYLIDEFEYIDSVVKQNIRLLKKWETSTSKDIVKGSESTIMNNEEAVYSDSDFKLRDRKKNKKQGAN